MTVKYSRSEVEEHLERMLPQPYDSDTSLQGQRTGNNLQKKVLSMTSSLFSSDPDSVLSLMQLAADRIVSKSSLCFSHLQEINQLLTAATLSSPKIKTDLISKIKKLFDDLVLVADGDYKNRKLREVDLNIKELVKTIKTAGRPLLSKSPEEARARISELLVVLEDELEIIRALHGRFFSAVSTAINNAFYLHSTEERAQQVSSQLESLNTKASINSSNATTALMVAAVGMAMVDDALKIVNPLGYKYTEGFSVAEGRSAKLIGSRSLPLVTLPAQQVAISIDGEDGSIQVPAATSAVLKTTIPDELFPFPHTVSTVIDGANGIVEFVKTPVDAPVKFKLWIANGVYNAQSDSFLPDVASVVTLLNSLTGLPEFPEDIIASSEGNTLTVTSPPSLGLGSASRILFFNDASVGVAYDGNIGLGLTYDLLGEARGKDTFFEDLVLEGFTSNASMSSSLETIGTEATTAIKHATLTKIPTTLPVQVGDKVIFEDSYYTVVEVADGHVYIFGKFLVGYLPSIGGSAAQGQIDELASAFSGSFTFVREFITVQSASTSHAITKVLGTGDNILGLASVGSVGEHDSITLSSSIKDGSPVRIGDVVLDSEDKKFGTIQGVSGKTIKISLGENQSFPGSISATSSASTAASSKTVSIQALGAYSYNEFIQGPSKLLNSAFASLNEASDFPKLIKQYMSSSSGIEVVVTHLIKYLEAFSTVNSVYGTFSAIVTKETKEFLNSLNETGLTVVKDMLLGLNFEDLRFLTTDDLSKEGKIIKGLGIISSEVSGGRDFLFIGDTTSSLPADDYDELDDVLSDSELPEDEESDSAYTGSDYE